MRSIQTKANIVQWLEVFHSPVRVLRLWKHEGRSFTMLGSNQGMGVYRMADLARRVLSIQSHVVRWWLYNLYFLFKSYQSLLQWLCGQQVRHFSSSTSRLWGWMTTGHIQLFSPIVIHLKGGCYQLRTVFEPYGLCTRSTRTGTCRKQTASYCENYLNTP